MVAGLCQLNGLRRKLMEKIISIALGVALVIALSIASTPLNFADAASHKAHRAKSHHVGGGGGCQTLSPSSLEQKASQYGQPIASASSKYGVSKDLIKAVITIESCFKSTARGSSGEKGLMQLMPGTARRFNINNGYNAWQNIHGGARYLSFLLGHYDGNARRAIAAYNAGEGNVSKGGRIPNSGYVSKVMHAYGKFSDGQDRIYKASVAETYADTSVEPRAKPIKAVLRQASSSSKANQAVLRAKVETNQVFPWDDLHVGSARGGSNTYAVKAGDTVYEVMRQTRVPVRQLISLNSLPAPYGIKAGQVLRLQ